MCEISPFGDFQYRAFAAYKAWTLLHTLRHIPTPLIHIHFIHWLSGTTSRYLGTIQDSRQQQTPSYVPRRPKKAVRRCVWQLMFTSNCIFWCLLVSDSVLWWLKMWRGRLMSSAGPLTSPKTSGAMFFFQNIASLSKKCDVFTRCFRFQKARPEKESMTNSPLIIKPRRPYS